MWSLSSKEFRGSVAVHSEGMIKARAASMPRVRARDRGGGGGGRCRGLGKRKTKVVRRETRRQKPSKLLLVLRLLLLGLLMLILTRNSRLGLYDLADLAHLRLGLLNLLSLRRGRATDARPSTVPNRRALAKHLQALRQQTPSAAAATRPTRALAICADTLGYRNSSLDIARVTIVVIGGVVKLKALRKEVQLGRARSTLAPAPRMPIHTHPHPHSHSHSYSGAASARLGARSSVPLHALVRGFRFVPIYQTMTSVH